MWMILWIFFKTEKKILWSNQNNTYWRYSSFRVCRNFSKIDQHCPNLKFLNLEKCRFFSQSFSYGDKLSISMPSTSLDRLIFSFLQEKVVSQQYLWAYFKLETATATPRYGQALHQISENKTRTASTNFVCPARINCREKLHSKSIFLIPKSVALHQLLTLEVIASKKRTSRHLFLIKIAWFTLSIVNH